MPEEMIRPLDSTHTIYALHDMQGNVIGTGTREVCQLLLYIIGKSASPSISGRATGPVERCPNVRSAMAL